MRRASVLLWSALVLALVPSCLVVDPPSGHMGGEVHVLDFCGEVGSVICTGYESCCPSHVIAMDVCVNLYTDMCNHAYGSLLIDARTGYSGTVAAEVIAEGRALVASCNPRIVAWYSARTGLFRVLQGTRPGGDTCMPMSATDGAIFFSCRNPLDGCVGNIAGSSYHCQTRQAVGQGCRVDPECGTNPELFCEGMIPGSPPPAMTRGTCQLRHDTGPCTTIAACTTYSCDATTHLCVPPMLTQQQAYCGLH